MSKKNAQNFRFILCSRGNHEQDEWCKCYCRTVMTFKNGHGKKCWKRLGWKWQKSCERLGPLVISRVRIIWGQGLCTWSVNPCKIHFQLILIRLRKSFREVWDRYTTVNDTFQTTLDLQTHYVMTHKAHALFLSSRKLITPHKTQNHGAIVCRTEHLEMSTKAGCLLSYTFWTNSHTDMTLQQSGGILLGCNPDIRCVDWLSVTVWESTRSTSRT